MYHLKYQLRHTYVHVQRHNSRSESVLTSTEAGGPAAIVKALTVTLYTVNLASPVSSIMVPIADVVE